MTIRVSITLALAAMIGACTTVPQADRTAPRQQPVIRPPAPQAPVVGAPVVPGVQVMNMPGLETVIGATASQLGSQFGVPALDVTEGDARKLQYRGAACVLEFYLYPAENGAQVTTWVEARRTSDGLDVDRAACIQALRR